MGVNGMRMTRRLLAILLVVFISPVFIGAAHALAGYEINWWTADSGGAIDLEAGGYSLSGTVGQADAGSLSNGDYGLEGGFWAGTPAESRIYLPLLRR